MAVSEFSESMWSYLEQLVCGDGGEPEISVSGAADAHNNELEICHRAGLLEQRVAGDTIFYKLTGLGKAAV
eukprot:2135945-Pyramimonas_sp.AAC.1